MSAQFKGSTLDCLAYFGGQPNSVERMKRLFPGKNIRTIERWVREQTIMPEGENLIRMRVLLTALGYEVIEFTSLEPLVQKVCKVFAYNLATLDELVSKVGYGDASGRAQLFVVLRGDGGFSADRQQRAETYIASLGNAIEEAERAFQTQFAQVHDASVSTSAKSAHETKDADAGAILDALAAAVVLILPLVRRVRSDDFTDKDREYVRARTGGRAVFDTANELYRLCGERARSTISNGSSEGGAQ
jgi:hypothetical protein